MTIYPKYWGAHGSPRACHEGECRRCEREQEWDERHEGCDCLGQTWETVDIGSPAVPDLQWICGECLMVMGPAYAGGVP